MSTKSSNRIARATVGVFASFLILLAAAPALADKKVDTAEAQQAFGVEMARRGLWSEALFRFRQAERMSPGNPRILNNLAVAYEALGMFERALEQYQDAIKADPSNRELKRNYSRFVEFYRSFKPPEPEPEDDTATRSADIGG